MWTYQDQLDLLGQRGPFRKRAAVVKRGRLQRKAEKAATASTQRHLARVSKGA